ncbi:GNAT family N-acetyltransferase [Candidatus Poribacteria bacterium]|nr:GNAT family N-acetyltransferase [Candidatus Poribacteria bacterium]
MIYKIRPAHLKDCQLVSKMITECAQKEGIMLPKTPQQIMENLSNFFVAEIQGQTIACCGYKIWVNAWAEIISLYTSAPFRHLGIGAQLLKECIDKARSQGFQKIFTLTFKPDWFSKRGFRQVNIDELPHKIWGDCAYCPKNAAGPGDVKCDEVPMVLVD